jgi:hypothetical protein
MACARQHSVAKYLIPIPPCWHEIREPIGSQTSVKAYEISRQQTQRSAAGRSRIVISISPSCPRKLTIGGPAAVRTGHEKIVKSAREGYLRVYTPEVPIYDEDGFIWSDNDNYRVVPESKGPVQTWFNERPLALKPGIYDVEVDYPSVDVVEPRDQNNYGKVRAAVKGGQITDIWLDDSDRPNLSNSKSSELTRDKYGDIIGYRDK